MSRLLRAGPPCADDEELLAREQSPVARGSADRQDLLVVGVGGAAGIFGDLAERELHLEDGPCGLGWHADIAG